MNAREAILSAIAARRTPRGAARPGYSWPMPEGDLAGLFAAQLAAHAAEAQFVDRPEAVPAAAARILESRGFARKLHVPGDAWVRALPWSAANIDCAAERPGADDAAVTRAFCAIAETGTLVHAAGPGAPAALHFLPGLEIALVARGAIVPRLEEAFARLAARGPLPHTVNLVTGPSRTADIEQTLELGAHGPKALAVLIYGEPSSAD